MNFQIAFIKMNERNEKIQRTKLRIMINKSVLKFGTCTVTALQKYVKTNVQKKNIWSNFSLLSFLVRFNFTVTTASSSSPIFWGNPFLGGSVTVSLHENVGRKQSKNDAKRVFMCKLINSHFMYILPFGKGNEKRKTLRMTS